MPNNFPIGCAQSLLRSAHGFQSRTTPLPLRCRASQLAGIASSPLTRTHRPSPPIPALTAFRQPGQARDFWLSAAPVRVLPHVTQTDPGTSASPRLSSRLCPRRGRSRVSKRTPGWAVGGGTVRGPGATPALTFLLPPSRPPPGPRGSGGGGAMAELTALESLIEMGFPRGRA